MKYYLGLDAGGTKTFCLVGTADGTIKGFGRAGAGNYEVRGVAPAADENRKAVQTALHDAGVTLSDISGIGMGIAGADLPEDYEMLEREMYTPLFGSTPRVFRNDSMAGLRGGTRNPYGIVIACGTGCVCAGRDRSGKEVRVGGLGSEFGDQCSGGGLGEEGLRAVWQAREEVIPPTLLTRKFIERSGCRDVEELFHKLYRRQMDYSELQPMAKLVADAAFEGDPVSCDILERGGRYLGAMVNAAARKLDMAHEAFEVVMAGSVFKGASPVLADAMRTVIHREYPLAITVMPSFEPVVGALLMGMEMDLTVDENTYRRLSDDLDNAETRYGVKFKSE
ncbi:MAG: hypothetical protein HZB26_07235 [Candidatus Hydrogenedentes bacterium]|nr:hypothetical protein [Candidatus Hydrogenedentota bacterium]